MPRTAGFSNTGLRKKGPRHSVALERVREWTRARFSLPDDAPVMVAEVACGLPGCPPLETVIAFWTEGEKRHHLKFFKPVEAVALDDFPPAWLKDSLAVADDFGAECC